MTERVNITLPASLLAQVDRAAAAEHTTRSAYLRSAVLGRLRGESSSASASSVAESSATYSPHSPVLTGPPAIGVLLDRLRAFCAARDDIRAALIFGSAAVGLAGPLSDVDVAVLLPEGWDPARRLVVKGELMDRIPNALGVQRADVVVLGDAAPALAHRALWDGIAAWGADTPALLDAKVRSLREYEDFRPVLDELGRALRERIEDGTFGR